MKKIIAFCLLVTIVHKCKAQTLEQLGDNTPRKSSLSLEHLTQFYQATVTSGKDGGYDFKSTLFGIKKFFSKNDLDASPSYLKNTPERNFEIGLGLHKGTDGDLNMLSGSFKYALINKRDKSLVNIAAEENNLISNYIDAIMRARDAAGSRYSHDIEGDASKEKALAAADQAFKKTGSIKEYPLEMQAYYNEELKKNPVVTERSTPEDFSEFVRDEFNRISKQIEQKALLTISFNPLYQWNHSRMDSTTATLQYLRGFGNYKKPWNVDFKAIQIFQRDTVTKGDNLSRLVFSATLGINKVLVYDSKLNPLVEFELAWEENYVMQSLYNNEERSRPKIVNVLRVNISKEVSLPLTLKYDLKDPNLFGIFKLQWDLHTSNKK